MVVRVGAAPAVERLAAGVADRVDLAVLAHHLQMPVDGRQADVLTALPQLGMNLLRTAEAGKPVQHSRQRLRLPGAADPGATGGRRRRGLRRTHTRTVAARRSSGRVRRTAYSAGTSVIRSAEVSIPARQTDLAMILCGSTRSRYFAAIWVISSSRPSDRVVGWRPEREELVVADDQLVLVRLTPRVGQVGDLRAGHVADHLGQVEHPVGLGDLVADQRPASPSPAGCSARSRCTGRCRGCG